jgi:hypothetical protein
MVTLLEGCWLGCSETVREEGFGYVEVSEARVEDAKDAFGELTIDGCVSLCRALSRQTEIRVLERVHSCDVLPATPYADPARVSVACSYTAQVKRGRCPGGRGNAEVVPVEPPSDR